MWNNVVLLVGILLEVGVLAGLITRRRVRAAVLLPFWLLAHIGLAAALLWQPTLMTWEFWNKTQYALIVLDALLALEVGARVSTNLPGMRRQLTLGLALSAVIVLVLLHAMPGRPFATSVLPAMAAGVGMFCLWTFTSSMGMAVPLDPLHRMLLLGLLVVSMLFTATWAEVRDDPTVAGHINIFVFLAFLAALLRVVWRRNEQQFPELARRLLWPWHA